MCLGIPLQVESLVSPTAAVGSGIEATAQPRLVDTSLLDRVPVVGDWLLVHVNVAIRALSAEEARAIGDALLAVSAAASGQPFEHLLGDLLDREPELPAHLRGAQPAADGNGQ
jgi:hydrogenase expression/formation protein HypC